jgi:peptide/nickel transport system permease protein
VHLRHALRNAVLPALTVAGVLVGGLLAGSVVVESVFSRTGVGRLTLTAVTGQDLPLVQGVVLLGAVLFVGVNLLVDLAYPLLDPRVTAGPPARLGSA